MLFDYIKQKIKILPINLYVYFIPLITLHLLYAKQFLKKKNKNKGNVS